MVSETIAWIFYCKGIEYTTDPSKSVMNVCCCRLFDWSDYRYTCSKGRMVFKEEAHWYLEIVNYTSTDCGEPLKMSKVLFKPSLV